MEKTTAPKKAILAPEYEEIAREFVELGSQPMRIACIYGADADDTQPSTLPTADSTSTPHELVTSEVSALRSLGHEVIDVGVSYRNLGALHNLNVDFVFNSCEGNGLDGYPGVEAILAMEKQLLPFSGVGSGPYHLSIDKYEMKSILAAAGIPVPAGAVLGHADLPLPGELQYPLFVKPRYGFCSIGIDSKSRAADEQACRQAIAHVVELTGVDALVEEYIEGREITVGIIGNVSEVVVLPPLEVQFGKAYEDKPQIRMYDTKANTCSDLYWDFHTVCPAPMPDDLRERVEKTALAAYRAMGCDGFGRVDIRLAPDGTPCVLEVNANCSLEGGEDEHDAGMLPLIARAVGWSYSELLACIVGAGLRRPLKRYRAPKLALRRENNRISAHATLNIRKGVRVAPVGAMSPLPSDLSIDDALLSVCGLTLQAEPHIRFLSHSEKPSLTVEEGQSGSLWLITTRSVKGGEELTLNREQSWRFDLSQLLGEGDVGFRERRKRRASSARQTFV